ncbi:RidA family protein [Sphingomonas panacisoli]|uniref:RidA family protein n=1 Tax=Sphingomonas panacisoli TaxID=1813879 RepID=A0A5B8LK37_9SPHN|nr:RidA family protein [Sphingomonas panacisoli]QDZ08269.1 RidA family protein [Sphingomonas panacisoli]
MHETLQPPGWASPIGYANGVAAEGRTIHVGGQVGWNAQQQFESDDLVDQVRQTLANIVAVLAAGGAAAEHIVSLTWYVTDIEDYLARQKEIGRAYRDVIGRHFPAMALVQVVRLVEPRAKVEIQATAVVPTVRTR